jgi:hypothetical protein
MIFAGNYIYIFGGFYHGSFLNTTYVIDLEEHEVKSIKYKVNILNSLGVLP